MSSETCRAIPRLGSGGSPHSSIVEDMKIMKYKIMVLDIDGTLTNSEKKITPKTHDALIDYQERGGKIAIASGRPTKGILPYAEKLDLKKYGGFIMAFNGGKILEIILASSKSQSPMYQYG